MKLFNLLQTQYNNFTSNIKNYLSKSLSDFDSSYGNSTIFGQLINVLGNVVQNIMLYIEDSLIEQNKYTAQRKKSIYGLASLSGYKPSYGKASSVQIKLSWIPTNSINHNIIINNKESLTCNQNGLQYNIILPQESIVLSIEKDNSDKVLHAIQGKFETQRFVSKGGKYYTINFTFLGNLDIDYLDVFVNGEKWEKVESFYDMNVNQNQYTYSISHINGIDIIFGNDIHGKSLNVDDVVEINYLLHDGEYGNLNPNQDTLFVFNNNLQDIGGDEINGSSIFNITFATNDPVNSGTNSESIDQVRQMIGYNSRSLVLASPENYKNLINKFSFCGYNRTWAETGSLIVNSIIMKNYKQLLNNGSSYFDLKENDFVLSKQQKQSIINYIESSGNQFAGITYNIFDPEICKYALYLYIKLKSTKYDKYYIENQVKNVVGEFFSDIYNDMFIPKSDIINTIKNNISEIDSVNAYFLSEKNETAILTQSYSKNIYNWDPINKIYNIKKEVVYLYPNENPNLGLDNHGNIYLNNNDQFPVLLGGWDYKNSNGDLVSITNPLIITFE